MAQLLRATDKGKAPMAITGEKEEDHPLGFTPPHGPTQIEALRRRPSVTIRPQHGPPPYPKWYDANARCEYHTGISEHSIENCTGFKKAVERLIKMGVVKFDSTPNTENPLPNHDDQEVNAIGEASERRMKENVAEVRMPMKVIWEEMMKRGMITSRKEIEKRRNYCVFHGEEGHETQNCEEFRALVSYKREISVLKDEQKGTSQPRIIISLPGNNEVGTPAVPKVIIHKPTPFPYKDSKRVPWGYDCSVTVPEEENITSASKDVQVECSHTWSGKHYDTWGVRERPTKAKGVSTKKEKGAEMPVKEPVKEEEAKEFLKFLKYSDADNFIYFNDDEIPLGGRGSTKALHITTRRKGYTLPSVLVDNGSALNVLPLSTLNRLPVDDSHMKTCQNVVRAFDGTERKVIGRIDIPLEIGPNMYEVDFLVMDIKPSYNFLLGRPWIHLARVVSSSLHQKLKLVTDGRLITINTEEDIIAAVISKAPYVETNEEYIEYSFRSLEFVNATFISEGSELPVPRIARATRMALHMMVGKEALPGKGLGKYLQGGTQIPELKEKRDRFGLGFKLDYKQRRKEIEKCQEGRRARLNRRKVEWEPMKFPPISQTFLSRSASSSNKTGLQASPQKLQRMRPDIVLKIKVEVKKQFNAGFLQQVKVQPDKDAS
ncbi:uncharacterized protein LOC128286791 [Gossypium arboreum]|uniref:uncharacterized protein LOC128286791 n=1 Tax=Gossypium arboreum TaxID=29729 RepID=UPI0022F15FB2|nr:uncharacterized protein LOC128286791 [Gossypium arboreum]